MGQVHNLDPHEVKAQLDAGAIVLVDVREPHEFAAASIPGSLSMPLSTFDPAALPQEPGKSVVLMCAGGVRSLRALEAAQGAGIDVDSHLAGGIQAWARAGLPVE
jgi:rhodanese-related sulfurtransferase